jgi:hypothetical protein
MNKSGEKKCVPPAVCPQFKENRGQILVKLEKNRNARVRGAEKLKAIRHKGVGVGRQGGLA